jgi:alanine racemase
MNTDILEVPARSTALKISLDAIAGNVKFLKRVSGNRPLLAVVKANSYGLGAVPVAKALSSEGLADYFGVATLYEGMALRNAGIREKILILGPLSPNEIGSALAFRLTPSVYSLSFLESLEKAASKGSAEIKVHIKVDSGMGRLGFRREFIPALVKRLSRCRRIVAEGLFSALASADILHSSQTARQLAEFNLIVDDLETAGIKPELVHLANSAGLMFHPETRLSMARPGLAMYGMLPSPELDKQKLKPVLRFETRIAQVKDLPKGSEIGYSATYKTKKRQRFALLPVGYADGLPRILSEEKGFVLIKGRKAPFRGRISMDLSLVSIDNVEAEEGDTVTLLGKDGALEISPWDWARMARTIPYEITCGLSPRVPRIYTFKKKEWCEIPVLA